METLNALGGLAPWQTVSQWPVDLSRDPALRLSFDVLRDKWSEVPFTTLERAKTSELGELTDEELLDAWTRGFLERAPLSESGWTHLLYRDVFRQKKVLDVGSGLGFDTIHFAEHGARVTFLDIARSNLRIVERMCNIKKLSHVSFCYLEDLDSLANLPSDFDFIYAEGSLINAPLEVTRREIAALLEHLPIGGRFVTLGYPKTRWEREGRLPEAEWGRKTDGYAPWIEWFDIDKVMWLLSPAKFEIVLHFELHNSDYIWFDLVRVKGASSWTLTPTVEVAVQPVAPTSLNLAESIITGDVQPAQTDWDSTVQTIDGRVEIETGVPQWAYACVFQLDPNMALDPDRYYWLGVDISVTKGDIGVGLLTGEELSNERFVAEGSRSDLFFPLASPTPNYLLLRNTSGMNERSRAVVVSARIVSEPKEPKQLSAG